jgi:spore coat polysaccharide biosynthesis predicted glycosyltransferase SpsG
LEVSEEPVAKVERVSKKEEVELEIKELFSNYKGGKKMRGTTIVNIDDENEESEKYSFLSVNQKVKKNLRRNK